MNIRRAATPFFLFAFLSVLCPTAIWAADVTLVPAGSVWKYLDDGSDQGAAWRAPGFNDSAWAAGPAQLGYGDGDEATIVSFGGNPGNRYVTTYFRTTVNVPAPSQFTSLILNLIRDDGAVVYVNGVEVWRVNMPGGTIAHDTLALSAVPDETLWQTVSISPSALVSGTNTIAVEMHQNINTSDDLSFDFSLVGTNAIFVTRGPYLQAGTHDSVIVRWRTNAPTDSQVRYGTALGTLAGTATDGVSTTEHEIKLTGLIPGTKYFYQVGASFGGLSGNDAATYFHTSPVPGTAGPYRFWVIGDAGTGQSQQVNVRNAFTAFNGSTPTDGFLMLGDNAYSAGLDSEYQSYVYDVYPSILRTTVLWPALGNHDTANSTTAPPSLPYFQMFSLPANGEAGGFPSGSENYYSFDYGNIHFIALDSMASSRAVTGTMANWLGTDLAQNTKRWTVVYFHHPPYSFGSHNSDSEIELVEMRSNIGPILEAGGVDLVLSGHSHDYERSYLIDGHYGISSTLTSGMKLNPTGGPYNKPDVHAHEGTVYIVAGSSGRLGDPFLHGSHPAMYASRTEAGSLVLDVDVDRLDIRFLTDTGTVADTFTLTKGVAAAPPAAPGGLTATPISSSQIDLVWTDNSNNEDGFKIERSTDGVSFTQIALTLAQTTTYSNTGLAAGTLYYYRVLAYNTAGNSAPATISATTGSSSLPPFISNGGPSGMLAPGMPFATLTVITDENATCRYSAVAGTAYAAMSNTFSTTGGLSHSTVVSGLSGGNSYNFYVRCVDTAGNANTTDYTISFSVPVSLPPDITTGLNGYWALNETLGTTASDSSGNGNTGTLINGPGWSAAGRVGGALFFDGVNDYVSLGNPASLTPGNAITLAAWIKMGDISANRFFIAKFDGGSYPTFLRYERGAGVKCVVGGTIASGPPDLITGQWYHAACTYDGAAIRLYLDGVQIATTAKTGAIPDPAGTDWLIGAGMPSAPVALMNGVLDEVRIYNRALTVADVALLSYPSALDSTPAALSNGGPSGTLPGGTTQATLTLTTDENATCRYSTVAGTAYAAMTNAFSTTGALSHSSVVTGLSSGNSYNFYTRCVDAAGNANTTDYTIGFSVADINPPVLSNGGPSGVLPAGTTQATLTVSTNESATCRYSTVAGTPYAAMTNTFSTTGALSHATVVTGLAGGNSYSFYLRCIDASANADSTDYTIVFSVAAQTDTTPPVLSNGGPSGVLPASTAQTTLTLTSNENATCRYSTTPGTAYSAMTNGFSTTGALSHSTVVGVSSGNSYTFYARCSDALGNANPTDYTIAFSVASGQPAPDITTGLRGYWALNETVGATASDSSGNNNAGTLINGPAWNSAGRVGGALSFDGVNDYVSLGNPASLIPGNAITLAGWIKLNDVSSTKFLIAKYAGPTPTFLRYERGVGIKCNVGGTGVTASTNIVTGQWYHAACTYDGAMIRVYINGVQAATGAKTGAIADAVGVDWAIGAGMTATGPAAYMSGLLDDMRLYNRSLTAADVGLLSNPTVPDTNSPVLSNGGPSGTLPAGTTQATLTVTTDENATCRYSTVAGIAYSAMTNTYSTTGALSHSTSVTGLSDGNSYSFFVRCLDAAGNANTTDYPISFSVANSSDITPPVLSNGGPSGTLSLGTTQATLTVATNENATCRYSTVAATAYPAMTNTFSTTGGTSHSTSVTGLSNGNSYSFFVRCLDTAGNANTADYTIGFSVAADTNPPVLSNGSPSGTLALGTTQATLTVATNENATCRYSTVAATAYSAMANTFSTTGGTAHSTSVTGLSNGNSYSFFVRCLDTAGNANTADYTIGFSVAADTNPPVLSNGSPSGTLALGTTQATLTVATNENATCRYSTVAATAYPVMTNTFSTTGGTAHSTSVTGLSNGNSYSFFVRCLDTAGNANTADYTIGFSVAADTNPPVLSNGSPSGTLSLGTTQATLTVATNENATCRYSTVAATAYPAMTNTFSTTGALSHSTSVTGLSGGNSYSFFVRCLDTAGNANTADYTIGFSVAADTNPPVLSNGGPSGTLPAGTIQATLTVTANENSTCRYSTVAGTAYSAMTNTFSTTGALSHSTSVTGLSGGNSYSFFVRCLDTAGNANTTDYTIGFSVASAPQPPDITTGLKGYWALNETAGNSASDSSGNNNAGTLINGPVWSSAGRVGGALSFDGVNDYVSLGNPASLIPGNAITLAGWVKMNDLSSTKFLIAKYAGPTPTFLRYERGVGIKCNVGGTGVTASANIVTGQWYHAACTYDGAMVRVYINGVQVATGAKTGAIADAVGVDWAIGAGMTATGPAAYMNGLLDDMRLYNRALTAADVASLSNP